MDRAEPSARFAAFLREQKEELIRRWSARVLSDPNVPEAHQLSEPDLRDHIPALINRIAGCIEEHDGNEAAGRAVSGVESREHARDRLAMEYRLTEALSELSHFRAVILELAAERGVPLDVDAARCLHAAIDRSMIIGSDEMERASVKSARERARVRERFIAILGHDLRTPLQAISTAASLLVRESTTEHQAQLARRILVSGERMGRMISDILDMTRARQGGGLPITPRQADLGAIVRQVVDELRLAHADRAVRISTHGDLRGQWDPDRMAQAVSNLVGNALTYSRPDTPVQIAVRGTAAHVLVAVNNLGDPIAPETMSRMFEPFGHGAQHGHGARGHGLGLGLFITQQIVGAHGGSIDVASTAEEGTTFTLRVPRGQGPQATMTS